MRIKTARGIDIQCDDADWPLLSQFSWYIVPVAGGRYYAHARNKTGKRVLMHRLLMAPEGRLVVHHKNNDGLDNRRGNLEVTTHRENIRAAKKNTPTSVHMHKQTGKWRAMLRIEGRQVSLGLHSTREGAIAAVEAAKAESKD